MRRASVQDLAAPDHYHATYAERNDTPLEKAVDSKWEDAQPFLAKIPEEMKKDSLIYEAELADSIFCGHLMTDLDSISGAIAAAHLYGGTPARASEINSETKFALEYWKVNCPETIEKLLEIRPDAPICLVDFQQQSQMNDSIKMENIVGIIDHHAIQGNSIVTEKPIFVDIRPWGSMSSILAHSFAVNEKHLPKPVAGMLLAAILSDTLNLRSPTTTKWDERMVSMLVQYIDADLDVNMYAASQFRAKSHELNLMSPYQLVNGDTKTFKFDDVEGTTHSVRYGVIETTCPEDSLARVDKLIPEMQECRDERNMTVMFLAVVDIVNLTSTLFLCGPTETSLAVAAYGGEVSEDGKSLPLKGLVSRKKDFVPALTSAFKNGWTPPRSVEPHPSRRESRIVMDHHTFPAGRLERVFEEFVEDDE